MIDGIVNHLGSPLLAVRCTVPGFDDYDGFDADTSAWELQAVRAILSAPSDRESRDLAGRGITASRRATVAGTKDLRADREGRADLLVEVPGWANNPIRITIPAGTVTETLVDFPLPVRLSSSSGTNAADLSVVFTTLGSDANRKRIAVTTGDGTTQCYVEITDWSTANRQAILWVKVPQISPAEDTHLYLYYDAGHADNTTYVGDTGEAAAQAVWDNGFAGVWLKPSGGQLLDSTSNANHGTIYGATEVDGPLGRCLLFDGIDDYVDLGNDASLQNFTAKTLLVWIRGMSGYTGVARNVYNGLYGVSPYGDRINLDGTQDWFSIHLRNTDAEIVSGYGSFEPGGDLILGYFWDGSTLIVFHNGIYRSPSEFTGTLACSAGNLTIGGLFDGYIPYIQISRVGRSPAWIAATRATLMDSLCTYQTALLPGAKTITIDGVPGAWTVSIDGGPASAVTITDEAIRIADTACRIYRVADVKDDKHPFTGVEKFSVFLQEVPSV